MAKKIEEIVETKTEDKIALLGDFVDLNVLKEKLNEIINRLNK